LPTGRDYNRNSWKLGGALHWPPKSGLELQKGEGLQLGNFEALAAADVAASYEVVAADHVGLGFGETGTVALVGVAGQLGSLAANNPVDLVFAGLAAVGANQGVGFRFIGFGKKIALFHHLC